MIRRSLVIAGQRLCNTGFASDTLWFYNQLMMVPCRSVFVHERHPRGFVNMYAGSHSKVTESAGTFGIGMLMVIPTTGLFLTEET